VEVFGGLDIVIANAGQSGRVELGGDLARAEAILTTNLVGAYYTFHAAAPRMRGHGRLLAVGSMTAGLGASGYAAYCASKAGILGLVRATAHELASKKITCNALVPGWVDTSMTTGDLREIAAASGKTESETMAATVGALPLGRLHEPEEVAEVAVFLCSSGGAGITGQAIPI
jgi:NAD(P)-dependent dehydrogenase (short-subunit alcohol dehydrogenase family)